MGYPGDQGKPDGRPPGPPSHATRADFGPEGDRRAPYGTDPYGNDSYGNDPYGNDPFGGDPSQREPSYGGDPYAADAYGSAGSLYEEGPGRPGPGGGPGTPPPPDAKKKRNLPLVIGGAALAGVMLIGGGVVLSGMLKDDSSSADDTAAAPSQTPTAKPSPTQPVLEPVKLKSRTTDPSPLTLKEAYGKSRFTAGGEKYVRTAWAHTRRCTAAANGSKLISALKQGGCTQALRATYARSDGLLVGTIGVFNLETEEAAQAAQRAAAAKDSFLEPLPGKGTSRTIGKGEALGTAEAHGHYLVMTWVQRPDGKKVATSKGRSVVSAFGQQITRNSGLSVALHYRETEGKPYGS